MARPRAGRSARLRRAKLKAMISDPYLCRRCRRVYLYLDLMGDPECECGSHSWYPVLISDQIERILDAYDQAKRTVVDPCEETRNDPPKPLSEAQLEVERERHRVRPIKRLSYVEKEAAFAEIHALSTLLGSEWFGRYHSLTFFLERLLEERKATLEAELTAASDEVKAKLARIRSK